MKFFKKKKTIYREPGHVLLHRWNIFECKYFSIKVHNLVGSDNSCQHNHPWPFLTFLIKGGYVEYTPADGNGYPNSDHLQFKGDTIDPFGLELVPEVSKVLSRFSLLYRPAHYSHRLEIHQPVWTLVISFKKKPTPWGFFTHKGFIKWFDYNPENHCD